MQRQTVVNELFTQKRINFPRRRVVLKGLGDLFQADLMYLPDCRYRGQTFKYALVVIDCFSKKVWCTPLADKTGKSVTEAMENILKYTLPPKNLHTDKGTEFFNETFKQLMSKHNINHYHTFTEKKAQIVERVIRTLKLWIYKEFLLKGHMNWVEEILDEVVVRYNEKIHRSTGVRPNEVGAHNETEILQRLNSNVVGKTTTTTKRRRPPPRFQVGDSVRISRIKNAFEKGYTYNWSPEIFTITKVDDKYVPVTYNIEDGEKQPIQGQFYQHELLKVRHKDVYLVEKVLQKKRGDLMKVRWLGFDKKHDSWIKISDSYM